ncbi:MAG TPA: response regulator [Verrucomicrobiae bacterium]|nr:response regulator [Verrucomicrobiae bacterium]
MADATAPLLLVEDDPTDLFILQRALRKANVTLPQHVATNGEEAINYLSGVNQFSELSAFPIPCAVFLDLKMPFISGFEVLEWVRSQPQLCDLNVVVLTGSSVERDRERALALGAKAYLVKPPTPQVLSDVLC